MRVGSTYKSLFGHTMRIHVAIILFCIWSVECRHLRQDKSSFDKLPTTYSRGLQDGSDISFTLINAKDNKIIDSIELDGSSVFDINTIGTNELTIRAESRISSSVTPATYVEFSWINDSNPILTSENNDIDSRSLQEYHIVQSQDIQATIHHLKQKIPRYKNAYSRIDKVTCINRN